MADGFRSSDEFDEHAHQLYNQARYDEALEVLIEGLSIYPDAVELHVGMGYAELAREEVAWARRSFTRALVLEPDHEDALSGYGETLLRLGDRTGALALHVAASQTVELVIHDGGQLFERALVSVAPRAEERADVAPGRIIRFCRHLHRLWARIKVYRSGLKTGLRS